MYKNVDIRQILEDFVMTTCFEMKVDPSKYQVKHMGYVKRQEVYKYGWYVQVQNFKNIYSVKRINDDRFWRFTFRSVLFVDETEPSLMVMKWIPSMRNVEESENIHQSKYLQNDPEFLQLMMHAISSSKLSVE